MASKKGVNSSMPSPRSPSSICCMCGDHGVTQELFRCKVCLYRSQHKYCSDLYLKTDSYRACNWCLRQEEGSKSSTKEPTKDSTSSPNASEVMAEVKLHRGPFSPQLSKPVKKVRLLDRSASDVTTGVLSGELSPGIGKGSRQVFRGKVRRYKLLEEVSS